MFGTPTYSRQHPGDELREGSQQRKSDLAGKQDVFARLRHAAVNTRHDQNRALHLRGTYISRDPITKESACWDKRTCDHVLDVVGVTRAVDVRVVTVLGLVLDVRRVNRDTTRLHQQTSNSHAHSQLRERAQNRTFSSGALSI